MTLHHRSAPLQYLLIVSCDVLFMFSLTLTSYQHKVASFNAANVWMLEQLAALLVARGKPGDAAAAKGFAADARAIATAVLSLYVPGEGVFKCRFVHVFSVYHHHNFKRHHHYHHCHPLNDERVNINVMLHHVAIPRMMYLYNIGKLLYALVPRTLLWYFRLPPPLCIQ